MAIDEVGGWLLRDGGFAVLFQLAENLFADERTEHRRAAQHVGAGAVDGGEDEGGGVDRCDGVGEES